MFEQLILLVEDNELNRDMLVRRLERAGHRVSTAGDGEAATPWLLLLLLPPPPLP